MNKKSDKKIDITDLFHLLRNHNDAEFIKQVNNSSIDLNYRDNQENYLITYAIRFNNNKIVNLLLKKGARYDVVDRIGRSILYDAIESNYIEILKSVLDHSQNAIGIMITDIRDSNGNIPIHYAIKFKNTIAIQLLIESGSKIYIADENGYNSLHLAVKTKNLKIVKAVSNVVSNFDTKNKKGETALHIAINYQYNDIAGYLLEQGADPNITDNESNFTPTHYAVGWNNYEILELLIKYGAKVDKQDIYGNTPLIYSVKEKNDACFDLIIKEKPNLNTWNVDGKIILHIVLDSYDEQNSKKYIDALIEDSNLSHQDLYGNTCLHYLIYLDLWRDYIKILERKRLNIFAKNSNNQMVVDFIKDDDFDMIINIVVKSYIYQLQLENNWTDEINKICSRELVNLTKEQSDIINNKSSKRKLNKLVKSDKNKLCHNIIEDRLRTTFLQIKNGELECCQKSYPYNKEDIIDVKEGVLLDITTFTGSLLDVLIGLLYLLKNHSNCCSTLKKDTAPNQTLCNFYKSMGLIMSDRCEFLNFELVWVNYKLYMIDNFTEMFIKCESYSKIRFIIIPLGIEMKTGSHANYLIYDKQIKELERFEPHGGTMPIGFDYNSRQLDNVLEQYILSIDPDITYIRPEEFIPKIGFQIMDAQEEKTHRIGDPGGFCALWSIWYVDQRLTYSHYSRDKLIKELFSNISQKGISYRNLIRNYSRNIIRDRDSLLGKVGIDINDWLNERYSHNTLDNFMNILNTEINSCCKFKLQ
jgi:ankyrin repeat protein